METPYDIPHMTTIEFQKNLASARHAVAHTASEGVVDITKAECRRYVTRRMADHQRVPGLYPLPRVLPATVQEPCVSVGFACNLGVEITPD